MANNVVNVDIAAAFSIFQSIRIDLGPGVVDYVYRVNGGPRNQGFDGDFIPVDLGQLRFVAIGELPDGTFVRERFDVLNVIDARRPLEIAAGGQDDLVFGGLGSDRLSGNSGNDALFGNRGLDTILGGAGDDHLLGATGGNLLRGGDGDDTLLGFYHLDHDGELDTMVGGAGADSFLIGEGAYTFIRDFESGVDQIVIDPDPTYFLTFGSNVTYDFSSHPVASRSSASLLYDTDTGELSYSFSTLNSPFLLAVLLHHPTLAVSDIHFGPP